MSRKVLVVDDSPTVRHQVERALVGGAFEVVEAEDGIDALDKAAQIDGLALVICDVSMPRMNGLDFLQAFRERERFKGVPVVMLTTEAQPELVQRAKALSAKGWIIKPFKPDLLLAAAKKLALAPAPSVSPPVAP